MIVGDGVITGIVGDTLEVAWEDFLTTTGSAQTVTVQIPLTGGINGIVLAQSDTISPTDSIQVLVIDQDRNREVSQRDSCKAPGCLDTLVGVFRRPSGWPLSDCL